MAIWLENRSDYPINSLRTDEDGQFHVVGYSHRGHLVVFEPTDETRMCRLIDLSFMESFEYPMDSEDDYDFRFGRQVSTLKVMTASPTRLQWRNMN